MAKPLQAASIAAPGFFGLNTQDSGLQLQDGFALEANNCVIDKFGRLGARKGWVQRTATLDGGSAAGINLVGLHHFIDFTGAKTTISWSDTTFYLGVDALTTLAVEATASKEVISSGNWMAATLNDLCFFYQEDYEPLVFDPSAGTLTTLKDFGGGPLTTFKAGFVLSAFGRTWITGTLANKNIVYFSDLNDGTDFTTGSAGSLNITSVFPKGTDSITGLAAHNGALVILCKNSVVVYDDLVNNFTGTITVTALTLTEVIQGIGCHSAKSIANTGEDVLFLDATGVRSLGRTLQEKSRPFRDISKNVRDDIINDIDALTDLTEVTSVYSPINAFYLLSIPSRSKVYCFDTKGTLEDGSFRVTTWSQVPHKAFAYDTINDLVNLATPAGIGEYANYTDDGVDYPMSYYTSYFDMGSSTTTKILKKMNLTLIGASGQLMNLKVGTNYSSIYTLFPYQLSSINTAEYGIAEYGIAEYSGGIALENLKSSIGETGEVIQLGFETTINGSALSLQKIDILIKTGRTI